MPCVSDSCNQGRKNCPTLHRCYPVREIPRDEDKFLRSEWLWAMFEAGIGWLLVLVLGGFVAVAIYNVWPVIAACL